MRERRKLKGRGHPRRRGHGRGRRRPPPTARAAVEALLEEQLGFRGFKPALEVEAARAAERAERESVARRDLTALATFTVDPATARDFDDAVSAQREGDRARVWVHIADVAAHVRPGSPLDLEARRRANSTYVPGAVEPMLPHALSSDACSLAPGVERLAVTAEIELSADGQPLKARFYRSLVRSDARLDYDQLDAIFAGRARAPEEVAEPLAAARDVAAALGEHRGTTSLDVESFEPEFRFDAKGNAIGAHGVAQTEAHRLIERLMVMTNEQVAEMLAARRVPAIYRVHAQPDPPRVEHLLAQLAALDVPTPPLRGGLAPRAAGELAAEASRLARREAARRGHGREAYTSLVLRSLQQAHYSEQNSGHAGLGSDAYTHFTSPIRRYPDLLVHRAIKACLEARRYEGVDWDALGRHCSDTERRADEASRDVENWLKCFYMKEHVGGEFTGAVTGVTSFGLFVTLDDYFVDGLVHISELGRDYFQFDAARHMLLGERSGKRFRLADRMKVRLVRVDLETRKIDFVPA